MDKSHYLSQNCFDPGKGAEFIQMKFHGTCLVKQTDFYRPHCFVLDFSSIREIYQDKFVRLFVQVENSATSLDRHRSYSAGICDNLGRNPKFTLVT